MNNKLKRRGIFKTFTLCSLAVLTMVGLTSCSGKADIYEGISPDNEYVKLGNKSITNKEMYDEFRWNSATVIQDKLNEVMIQNYVNQVKDVILNKTLNGTNVSDEIRNSYLEGVQDYLICAVYAIDDVDSADELNNPYLVQSKEAEFIDTTYSNHQIRITEADVKALVARDTENHKSDLNYDALSKEAKDVFAKYFDEYAEKLFATDYLKKEIKTHDEEKDEDEDAYYSDSEIITHWNENYKYKYDLKAILIRFSSQDEVDAVLKTFGLKTYRSNLYFIRQKAEQTDSEYSKYYDDFDFAVDGNDENVVNLSRQTQAFMLSLYIEMYNYVYPYRTQIKNIEGITEDNDANRRTTTRELLDIFDGNPLTVDELYNNYIKPSLGSETDYITFNGEKLDTINSSLKSYLYTTLKTGKENESSSTMYSSQAQSYGDYYYMAFKINDALVPDNEKLHFTDNSETELDWNHEITEDFTDEQYQAFLEFLDKLKGELVENEITQSYIETALTDSVEDAKIEIYDDYIEIAYKAQNSTYSTTKKNSPGNGIIAKIEFKYNFNDKDEKTSMEIKTTDIWQAIESVSGISTAVDILSKQVIKDQPVYNEILNDKEKVDEFYDTLNVLLANFSNGQLASYGYDSSLGKYNFMMLYFHTNDVDSIIKDFYCVNEASTRILTDYSSDALTTLLKDAANAYRPKNFTVGGSNLLVYVDMDEDGNPDRDFDWTQNLPVPSDAATTYSELAVELLQYVITIVENSTSANKDTLTSIVDEYKTTGRFTNGIDSDITDGEYDPTNPETIWAKYRVNGLQMKIDDIASVTNNTQYGEVVDVLKIAMYKTYNDNKYIFDKDGENPSVPTDYLETTYYEGASAEGLLSVNGYNLYTLTSASINETPEFNAEDDPNGYYTNLGYIYNDKYYNIENLYSDGKNFSDNQVKAFLLEYGSSQTSNSLPESIQTAITTYLQPMYTRFTSDTSQFYILISFLESYAKSVDSSYEIGTHDAFVFNLNNNSSFSDENGSSIVLGTSSSQKIDQIIKINQRSEEGYLISENVYKNDSDVLYTFFKNGDTEGFEVLKEIENLYTIGDYNWWDSLQNYAKDAFSGVFTNASTKKGDK